MSLHRQWEIEKSGPAKAMFVQVVRSPEAVLSVARLPWWTKKRAALQGHLNHGDSEGACAPHPRHARAYVQKVGACADLGGLPVGRLDLAANYSKHTTDQRRLPMLRSVATVRAAFRLFQGRNRTLTVPCHLLGGRVWFPFKGSLSFPVQASSLSTECHGL